MVLEKSKMWFKFIQADNCDSEKLTWAFSSGEPKSSTLLKICKSAPCLPTSLPGLLLMPSIICVLAMKFVTHTRHTNMHAHREKEITNYISHLILLLEESETLAKGDAHLTSHLRYLLSLLYHNLWTHYKTKINEEFIRLLNHVIILHQIVNSNWLKMFG